MRRFGRRFPAHRNCSAVSAEFPVSVAVSARHHAGKAHLTRGAAAPRCPLQPLRRFGPSQGALGLMLVGTARSPALTRLAASSAIRRALVSRSRASNVRARAVPAPPGVVARPRRYAVAPTARDWRPPRLGFGQRPGTRTFAGKPERHSDAGNILAAAIVAIEAVGLDDSSSDGGSAVQLSAVCRRASGLKPQSSADFASLAPGGVGLRQRTDGACRIMNLANVAPGLGLSGRCGVARLQANSTRPDRKGFSCFFRHPILELTHGSCRETDRAQ